MNEDNGVLKHYGILKKSGRYPWGSGKNPYQRSMDFSAHVADLKAKGLSDKEIADGFDLSIKQLRETRSIAKDVYRAANATTALKLKDKGYSTVAIAERMGMPESSVRALLDPAVLDRTNITMATADMLRDQVAKVEYLDIGKGTENHIGISKEKLGTAVAILKDEGYQVFKYDLKVGTEITKMKVLVAPGADYKTFVTNPDKISTIAIGSKDGGRTFIPLRPPENVDSKRVEVNYVETGGGEKDGVIELRPGVKDLDLGAARYAQVRIAVDGTHYLKGMAVYNPDLPPGVDIRFNTNKSNTTSKLDTMKPMKLDDPDNPFGASIKPNGQRGALNILTEEGDWHNWSRTLSSQMLSKQKPQLAKQQLDLTYNVKKEEYDEIMSLNNPTIKKKLLKSFSDDMDASAVHLKAAGLPRTRNHVILPMPHMKPTEIYAPNYQNGDRVVLIRHPHGGIFEIPELTVNNNSRIAKQIIGANAMDAVGINPKVAEQLSGADFDGDTVLVIPNKGREVKNSAPLKGLKNFDPKTYYPGYEGMKTMTNTQLEMGVISNLITDMTIKAAHEDEIARAVRHSMVVIDAEKHGLNYKQSYIDNGIANLKAKYQGSTRGGASTLISLAKSEARPPKRKPRTAAKGGPIDLETGELRYEPTEESFVRRTVTPTVAKELALKLDTTVEEVNRRVRNGSLKDPRVKEKTIVNITKSTKMAETNDARTLSSGTVIEEVYVEHANKLKGLANQARKSLLATPNLEYSATAAKTYAPQVKTLLASLNTALMNAPLERKAQLIANVELEAVKKENPHLDRDDIKKIKNQALTKARARIGASKTMVTISPIEWEAIQAGAISDHRLSEILNNTDVDVVKQLAMPRESNALSPGKAARVLSMAATGYTQADIAEALGVSVSTVVGVLNE